MSVCGGGGGGLPRHYTPPAMPRFEVYVFTLHLIAAHSASLEKAPSSRLSSLHLPIDTRMFGAVSHVL